MENKVSRKEVVAVDLQLMFQNDNLISEKFSLSLAPTYIYENLATSNTRPGLNGEEFAFGEENDQFAAGVGGRFKLTTRWSLNADHGIHLNRNKNSNFRNPLSIGVDLESGGHVFQMHLPMRRPCLQKALLFKEMAIGATGIISSDLI